MTACDSSTNLVQLNEKSDEVNVDRPRRPSKLRVAGMAAALAADESTAPAVVPTSMASQMWRTSTRETPESPRRGSVAERPHGRGLSAVAAARLSRQPNLADMTTSRPIDEYASTLQAHFDEVAGDDGELDLGELTQVLKTSEASKSPTETFRDDGFARLLFRMIDADGSGLVSRDEYVDTMVRLRFGTTEQRLHLLFCLYDEDGSGGTSTMAS